MPYGLSSTTLISPSSVGSRSKAFRLLSSVQGSDDIARLHAFLSEMYRELMELQPERLVHSAGFFARWTTSGRVERETLLAKVIMVQRLASHAGEGCILLRHAVLVQRGYLAAIRSSVDDFEMAFQGDCESEWINCQKETGARAYREVEAEIARMESLLETIRSIATCQICSWVKEAESAIEGKGFGPERLRVLKASHQEMTRSVKYCLALCA